MGRPLFVTEIDCTRNERIALALADVWRSLPRRAKTKIKSRLFSIEIREAGNPLTLAYALPIDTLSWEIVITPKHARSNVERLKHTIAHEFAHVALNHLDFGGNKFNVADEYEADQLTIKWGYKPAYRWKD